MYRARAKAEIKAAFKSFNKSTEHSLRSNTRHFWKYCKLEDKRGAQPDILSDGEDEIKGKGKIAIAFADILKSTFIKKNL
ncbi:hypothetical protein JTE90_015556 [Oedothorax gibbosus]|uniref:Mos1 transposase HTH domain-containing protein n=1 Tax=Oedothorax gibbosus TaxID=931172 RepID=A0AAV6TU90_9ARAC|nr:hypothetical protein JTE90_015556 [Oedothorax gibbosus]